MRAGMWLWVVAAVMFSASEGLASDLIDFWTYNSQSCSSGAPPNPALEEPEGWIEFESDQMNAYVSFDGGRCGADIGPVPISISADTVTPLVAKAPTAIYCIGKPNVDREIDIFPFGYTVSGNRLTTTSLPIKEPGLVCPVGDSKIMEFIRYDSQFND